MRQLVGLECVRCRERIPSDIDGHFCRACGCPVHHACIAAVAPGAGACETCGASADDIATHTAEAEKYKQMKAAAAWDAPSGAPPDLGVWGEWSLYRRGWIGFSFCAAGLMVIVNRFGGPDSGTALAIGLGLMALGAVLLFFVLRELLGW